MISLLLINYRSAALAIDAIRSARAATTSQLQVVVVDNSVDVAEAERLRPHADIFLAAATNLGYAGGINAGRPHCRGEVIVVSNPDVVFGNSALDELLRALDEHGASVAGPALYWDDGFTWMLPPGELHTVVETLDEAIASRSRSWATRRDRRRIAARLGFWSLTTTVETRALSGAVMAIRAADLDKAGGFDPRFPLYFEENDLLRRFAADGKRIVYVPSARCRHLYNQSAGRESDRAAATYADSEMRYLAKWHGRTVARFVKAVARPRHTIAAERIDGAIVLPAGDFVIEASPLSSFDTAAGHFPASGRVDVPAEVWSAYRDDVLYLRVIARGTLDVIATYARYKS
jgi:N-acetylglucosaminyl-diphospho-decaprenol L-rhamnosyltransferase